MAPSKFQPEAPQTEADRQTDVFTRRETETERAARIAAKPISPKTIEAVKRAFFAIKVVCLECGRKFTTASLLPECPKCGGSDVEDR